MPSKAVPNLYKKQFSSEFDFPVFKGTTQDFVIASTGRCGSHMVGHTLWQTSSFGFPLEYLNPVNLRKWNVVLNVNSIESTVHALRRRRTGPNGVFGIKIHRKHLDNIGGRDAFERLFPHPKVLFLFRNDTVAQAVSFAKAIQTGSWIAEQPVVKPASYDFHLIKTCLDQIETENAMWRRDLVTTEWMSVEMSYERFLMDPSDATLEISTSLGIAVSEDQLPSNLVTQLQRDQTNIEWKTRFLAEVRNAE